MTPHPTAVRRTCTGVAGVFAMTCLAASLQLHAGELQVDRYSMYSATPTAAQKDLLAATVTLRFPDRIQTVGESIRYLLQRSGYRVAAPDIAEDETRVLFALPLPAVHRSLGPMSLRDALLTLAGPAFQLVQDPVHRLITFEQCGTPRSAVSELSANTAKEGAPNEQ